MATTVRITERDLELLTALDRCPLTAGQLLKLSRTFGAPFRSESRVRGRLQALLSAGCLRRWPYAAVGRGGAPDYYKLTPAGYRLLYGEDAVPPTKRYSAEIGLAHQHHTRCLADFIVHTLVEAHAAGLQVIDFCRENTLRLPVGEDSLFPDCAFRLRDGDACYNFLVELDNGTERIRTQKSVDSLSRKITLYDRYQEEAPERFRVLVVTTRSRERLDRVLETARESVRNPQRSLFYGVYLGDYLAAEDSLRRPVFRDHRSLQVGLVPRRSPAPSRDRGQPALAAAGPAW